MFNVGGPELLVILLLALIVLGPQRLPDAARQVGRFMGEMRRLSGDFQRELRSAMDEQSPPATNAAEPAPPPPVPGPAKKAAPRRRSAPLRAPGRAGSE